MNNNEIKIRLDEFEKKLDVEKENISQIMTVAEERMRSLQRVMQTEFSERICNIYAELDSLRAEAERVVREERDSVRNAREEKARAILEEAQRILKAKKNFQWKISSAESFTPQHSTSSKFSSQSNRIIIIEQAEYLGEKWDFFFA